MDVRTMLAAAIVAVSISGCVSQEARESRYAEIVAGWPDEGERPTDAFAQSVVKDYFRLRLKDAASAVYEWQALERGTVRGRYENFGTSGWVQDVLVNAKNSFGGYTGFKRYRIVMRSGAIVEAYEYNPQFNGWDPRVGLTPIPKPAEIAEEYVLGESVP